MSNFKKEITETLHKVMETTLALEKRVLELERQPPVAGKLKNRSSSKISRNPQARDLALTMFKNGATYKEITETINNSMPDYKVSEASVGRYLFRYRREYSK